MNGKGQQPQAQPALAGLSELDLTTAQTDVPHPYFAGVRKLPVAWIMLPVIAFVQPSQNSSGKGK